MASRVPLGTTAERCKKLNIYNTCTSVNHTIGSCLGLKNKKTWADIAMFASLESMLGLSVWKEDLFKLLKKFH